MNDEGFIKWSCKEREHESYSLGKGDIRRWYQRDIDQITHSTCFRKLQRKSQLLSEKDPRSRSRLIHTIEVSCIAMEISEKLGLSKELTEAICLAHDIGTSPYGCVGNSFLQKCVKQKFSHELAGAYMLLMISQKYTIDEEYESKIETLVEDANFNGTAKVDIHTFPGALCASRINDESRGKLYYLHHISPEILDGVYNHGASGLPNTLEGQVVRFADNIAYLSQDIEDLITTKLLDKRTFTKFTAVKDLEYVDESSIVHAKTWDEIDNNFEENSLKDAFSEIRGRRIAAFVERFVKYNLAKLSEGSLELRYSHILKKKIPVFEFDQGANFVIQYLWNFIEKFYKEPLIQTSNDLQLQKMALLWKIIQTSEFRTKNTSFKNFMNMVSNNSIFQKYSLDWKMAFFISHLSWLDIDLVIDSYHERNNTFELDISY